VTLQHETCITCGDVALEALVVDVDGATATVEVDGRRESVGVELVAPVSPGELLLCHAGIALARIEEAQAP
jgi:hydrogenase maturation factor